MVKGITKYNKDISLCYIYYAYNDIYNNISSFTRQNDAISKMQKPESQINFHIGIALRDTYWDHHVCYLHLHKAPLCQERCSFIIHMRKCISMFSKTEIVWNKQKRD